MRRRRTNRRPNFVAAPVEAPIADLNTTPLIDVMLVLLIMFIVTIPIATHGIKIDLPSRPGGAEPEMHRLDLDGAGRLLFDGATTASGSARTSPVTSSMRTRQKFMFPPLLLTKYRYLPSGDHTGFQFDTAKSFVTITGSPPAAETVAMSRRPKVPV